MFSIKVKGKPNPKNSNPAKLELVIFQTDYPRVTKVLDITVQGLGSKITNVSIRQSGCLL